MARVEKVMGAGHRLGGNVGWCSSSIVCGNIIVGSELVGARAHTDTFCTSARKASIAKFLQEAKLLK